MTDNRKVELLKVMIKNFFENFLPETTLRKIDKSGKFPKRALSEMKKIGLFSLKIPKEFGGCGLSLFEYIVVIEEISKYSAVTSIYVATANSLATGPLLIDGTEKQKKGYIPKVASGEKNFVFALTEPQAGSDAASIKTVAKKDGDYYILSGRKSFITMAPIADYAIVYAKTDKDKGTKGISAFIVDMKQSGVEIGKEEAKIGVIGCPTGDILLNNVKVHKNNILGKENEAFKTAMKTLNIGRLGVAAQAVGVAQSALDEAINYSKERKQFSQRICDFQSISFTLSNMATKLEAARSLLYRAIDSKDKKMGAMAKYYCSEVCNQICYDALQIHGGYGCMKNYKIERLYRDCRVFTIYEGTSQIQQLIISKELLK